MEAVSLDAKLAAFEDHWLVCPLKSGPLGLTRFGGRFAG